VKLEIV